MRLFATCWIIYVIHFSPNIVREIYLALSLGDQLSFRVDEYAHLHDDLFEKEGFGWHIGNNPGASMLAAIPYVLARPVIEPIVRNVARQRAESSDTQPPSYGSPYPKAREFYAEAWRRGLDVKFGLAALVMQSLCMAPISALGVLMVFYLLRHLLGNERQALLLALLYAFGTPVFFRTGYLNQNMMLGHIAFAGFLCLWNISARNWPSSQRRYLLAGLAGGTALLFDYSGAVILLCLFFYGIVKHRQKSGRWRDTVRHSVWYVLGTLPPVLLLWFYQWKSFGNAFLPGQHWMPPVEWIERGYQGYGPPQFELMWALVFDYRFGLFVSCPLFLLAFAALWYRGRIPLPSLELFAMLGTFFALWVFFSGSNYTRLQFNCGVRYMAPIFPFLFIPAALVLVRWPKQLVLAVSAASVALSWCLAMHRDVETGPGILSPVLHVFLDGFRLPVLTSMSRMEAYQAFIPNGGSPLPVFVLTAMLVAGIWLVRRERSSSIAPA